MENFILVFGVVVGFVLASIVWELLDRRHNRELEDELVDKIDELDQLKKMHSALLADNKRMLAALNHYQIKGYHGGNGRWIRSR